MSDPVTPPANGGAAKAESQKPTKAVPTDRVSVEKQMAVLRAYGAIAADKGVTAAEVGAVVPIHPASVSVCNPFFTESGLIERSEGGGNKAAADVVAFHRAMGWDPNSAAEKLAPTLRQTWYWRALAPRLSFRALDESEAVRVLADEVHAGATYKPQIKMILDYLEAARLTIRDGTQIKKGPLATPETEAATKVTTDPNPKATEVSPPPAPPAPAALMTGISFDASIRITEQEMASWTPEQIKEFFVGLAAVIAAKNRAG
jgi:hypothetical protein